MENKKKNKKNIILLDCTLRDGGALNNWLFGNEIIHNVFFVLNHSNIEIIELGFIDNNEIYNKDRTIFPDCSYFENFSYLKKSKIYAMIDFSKYNLDKFNIEKSKNIDGIRIMFKKEQKKEALELANKIKHLGYEISLNPVSITKYSNEEFVELIKQVNEIIPEIFYIVDTYGVLTEEETLNYYKLADKNLNKEIKLGYHVHNSLNIALKNAVNILNQNTKRTIVIDASILGMGKRAGNIETEKISKYLNNNYSSHYDTEALDKISEKIIKPLKGKFEWGYSNIHHIAAKNKCISDYATYLHKEKKLSIDEIDKILSTLPNNLKLNLDLDFVAKMSTK